MSRNKIVQYNSDFNSYDLVANEYYHRNFHPTCYNFNQLSRLYIERRFQEQWKNNSILEVGAGDSAVAALLSTRGHSLCNLKITDASAAMLGHSQRWRDEGATTVVCPAQELSANNNSYANLVSSLGDPYNTSEFWREANRVLLPGGRLIFTTPSFEWSRRFRPEGKDHSAEFILADSRKLNLPSFIWPLASQIDMMEAAGFLIVHFESLGEDQLHSGEILSKKLAVFENGQSSFVWGFELVKRSHSV